MKPFIVIALISACGPPAPECPSIEWRSFNTITAEARGFGNDCRIEPYNSGQIRFEFQNSPDVRVRTGGGSTHTCYFSRDQCDVDVQCPDVDVEFKLTEGLSGDYLSGKATQTFPSPSACFSVEFKVLGQ